MRITTVTALAGFASLSATCTAAQQYERGSRNTDFDPAFAEQFRAPLEQSPYEFLTETLASGLDHPWAVEQLPGGQGLLVTERSGALRHVSMDGTVSDPIGGVPEVFARGQGGLLDVKAGPDFADTRHVYLTYAKPKGNGMSVTAAARAVLSEDMSELTDVTEIFEQSPPSPTSKHYGSRIVFDGAGHAYITTGEHSSMQERVLAQDLGTTYGKIVRVTLDGEIPQDNPFVGQDGALDEIWSYGHRNIQGAAMRGDQLFALEHGPKGGDEINIVEPGKNYGWPVISYGETYGGSPIGSGEAKRDGMEQPAYFWDPVIAPGDMTFYTGDMFPDWDGDLLIGGLVADGIVRLAWDGDRVSAEERLLMQYGRVRDVEVLEDGSFILATDYADGELIHVTRDGNES